MSESAAGQREIIFNKAFIMIAVISFLHTAASQVMSSVLPLYLENLGLPASVLGTATSLSAVAAMIAAPPSGRIVDTKGGRNLLFFALLVMAAGMVGFYALPYVLAFILIRILQGFAAVAVNTSQLAVASKALPQAGMNEGLSYFAVCATVAGAVGPTLGLAMIINGSFVPALTGSAILFVAAAVLTLSIREGKINSADWQKTESKGIWNTVEKTALRPAVIYFLTMLINSGVLLFLPIYAKEQGVPNIGAFYIVQAFTMFAANVAVGRIIDQMESPRWLLICASAFLLISLIILYFANGLTFFLLAAGLVGLGTGIVTPAATALAMSAAPLKRRGAASATLQIAQSLSYAVGSAVWGVMADLMGYHSLYGILIIFPVLTGIVCFVFYSKD